MAKVGTGVDLDALLGSPGALTGGRTFKEVLDSAIELIADPSRWTQKAHARDEQGRNVKPRDPRAVCWCGIGALAKCSNVYGIVHPEMLRYLDNFVEWKHPNLFDGFQDFQDYFRHDIVIALLREASSNMEAR